jgi:hypothetical protein
MQCRNMGGSYGDMQDIQWSCTAEVPEEFKLGRTEVVCEGYSSPDDVYILKGITTRSPLMTGSCAVEYTLHLTPKGKEVYLSKGYKNPFSDLPSFTIPELSLWDRFSSSFFLFNIFRRIKDLTSSIIDIILNNPILILATVYFNYRLIRWTISTAINFFRWFFPRTPLQPRRRQPPFWSSFFGGGGGGGNDPPGPPPPYTRNPPRKTYQVPPETQAWNPGFWTGLASGAAAGYGFGRRGGDEPPRQNTRTFTEVPAPGRSWWGGSRTEERVPPPQSSGWFGGSTGGASTSQRWERERERDHETSSGSTHTSTGFGGTRRR